MTISLTQDIKTVSELKKSLRAVLDQIRETGRPVVVTVNGKADAVLIGVETYETKLKALNLVPLLAEGEEDQRRGGVSEGMAACQVRLTPVSSSG